MDAHQTNLFTAILITSVIVGSILVFFIVTLIIQQRRNNKLYLAKIQAEILTLEKERSRISSDLHDELGPLLSAAKLKLSSIDIQSDEDENTMNKALEHITDIVNRMREISNNLMPATLGRKGLIYAIEEFITKVSKPILSSTNEALSIKFTHKDVPFLSKEMSINVYRIIQEIVHNAIKHSKATFLSIDISIANSQLVLQTEDNGIGFNYQHFFQENGGLGLRNLISRSDILGGSFYIDTKEGNGTRYTIEIPIVNL